MSLGERCPIRLEGRARRCLEVFHVVTASWVDRVKDGLAMAARASGPAFIDAEELLGAWICARRASVA